MCPCNNLDADVYSSSSYRSNQDAHPRKRDIWAVTGEWALMKGHTPQSFERALRSLRCTFLGGKTLLGWLGGHSPQLLPTYIGDANEVSVSQSQKSIKQTLGSSTTCCNTGTFSGGKCHQEHSPQQHSLMEGLQLCRKTLQYSQYIDFLQYSLSALKPGQLLKCSQWGKSKKHGKLDYLKSICMTIFH